MNSGEITEAFMIHSIKRWIFKLLYHKHFNSSPIFLEYPLQNVINFDQVKPVLVPEGNYRCSLAMAPNL